LGFDLELLGSWLTKKERESLWKRKQIKGVITGEKEQEIQI
jgi:hypothetical protein